MRIILGFVFLVICAVILLFPYAGMATPAAAGGERIWTMGAVTFIAGALVSAPYWFRLLHTVATVRPAYTPVIFATVCGVIFCAFYTIGVSLERVFQKVLQFRQEDSFHDWDLPAFVHFYDIVVWVDTTLGVDISHLDWLFMAGSRYVDIFLFVLPFGLCVGPLLAYYNSSIGRHSRSTVFIRGAAAYVFCLFMLDIMQYRYLADTLYSMTYPCKYMDDHLASILADLTGGLIGGTLYAFVLQVLSIKIAMPSNYMKIFDGYVNNAMMGGIAAFVVGYTVVFVLVEYRTVTPISGLLTWTKVLMDVKASDHKPQIRGKGSFITITHDRTIARETSTRSIRDVAYEQPWFKQSSPEQRANLEKTITEMESRYEPSGEMRVTCTILGSAPCTFKVYDATPAIEKHVSGAKLETIPDHLFTPNSLDVAFTGLKQATEKAETRELKAISVPHTYMVALFRENRQKQGVEIRTVGGTVFMRNYNNDQWQSELKFLKEFESIPLDEGSAPGIITLISQYWLRGIFDGPLAMYVYSDGSEAKGRGKTGEREANDQHEVVYGETEDGSRIPINLAKVELAGKAQYGAYLMLQPLGQDEAQKVEIFDNTADDDHTADITFISPEFVVENVQISRLYSTELKGELKVGKDAYSVDHGNNITIRACGQNLMAASDKVGDIGVSGKTNLVYLNETNLAGNIWGKVPPEFAPWLWALVSPIAAAGVVWFWSRRNLR